MTECETSLKSPYPSPGSCPLLVPSQWWILKSFFFFIRLLFSDREITSKPRTPPTSSLLGTTSAGGCTELTVNTGISLVNSDRYSGTVRPSGVTSESFVNNSLRYVWRGTPPSPLPYLPPLSPTSFPLLQFLCFALGPPFHHHSALPNTDRNVRWRL